MPHCGPGRESSDRRRIKRQKRTVATVKGWTRINQLPGKTPLPPVSRKQKGSAYAEQEVKKSYVPTGPPSSQLISREEKRNGKSQAQGDEQIRQEKNTSDVPSDHSDVTEEDIERCYDIGRVVGDGNFAVVRECRRRDNGQTLAVKIVERSKLAGREHMMQNELSLLGSLCHPRIVRLFAHRHTRTHSYLVMELVTGGDLFEAISERGTFSELEAGLMVSDVGEALNYIHCKSIVHRDIKPENLLVSIERVAAGVSRLKLGDFGLAMVVTEPVFTICGTPTYVAPEILNETGYGVAVDVWALGVILYILLCGFPPFRSRDRNQEELFKLIKQGHLHFLSPFWDHISEEARGLVRALLQPEPTVRLTAGQTLLHPWVKAMAADCRQGAPNDKAKRNTVKMKAEQDQAQQRHQNNASELTSEKSESTKKEPISPFGMPEVHTTNCRLTCSSSREVNLQEIQDLAPELSNTHCSPENRMSLRSYFSGPVTQMDPLPQIKSQSQQNSQQCSTLQHTSASTNQRQTVLGHIVSTRPSSNPATASSSQSLHQQNSSCSHYNGNSSTSPNPSLQDCMEHVAHGANTQSPHCEPAP
uniref:Doublecortin-like kinase 3 n=1 Tax=Takifugu rubripes TaxID=31033 RepID=A0A674ND97_TAKRU